MLLDRHVVIQQDVSKRVPLQNLLTAAGMWFTMLGWEKDAVGGVFGAALMMQPLF